MKERPDQFNWRPRLAWSADSHVRPPLLAAASPASRFPGLSSSVRYPLIAQSGQASPRRCRANSPAPLAVIPDLVRKVASAPPPYDSVLHCSVDSKWTGPFSTRFRSHCISIATLFPKAGYTNTRNSKWTKRIDFSSILVHFETVPPSRPSPSVFHLQNKFFGKEKVKKK